MAKRLEDVTALMGDDPLRAELANAGAGENGSTPAPTRDEMVEYAALFTEMETICGEFANKLSRIGIRLFDMRHLEEIAFDLEPTIRASVFLTAKAHAAHTTMERGIELLEQLSATSKDSLKEAKESPKE